MRLFPHIVKTVFAYPDFITSDNFLRIKYLSIGLYTQSRSKLKCLLHFSHKSMVAT